MRIQITAEDMRKERGRLRREETVRGMRDGRVQRAATFKSGTEYKRRGKYPSDYR